VTYHSGFDGFIYEPAITQQHNLCITYDNELSEIPHAKKDSTKYSVKLVYLAGV